MLCPLFKLFLVLTTHVCLYARIQKCGNKILESEAIVVQDTIIPHALILLLMIITADITLPQFCYGSHNERGEKEKGEQQ